MATDASLAGALRSALQAAGFTVERVEAELGGHELRTRPVDLSAHRRRLPTEGSFAVLARLFLLGDAVALEELGRAVAPVGVDGVVALGLCVVDGGRVRPTVKLVPHGDYYIVSDTEAPAGAETPFDYVPGVQAPSVTLAKLAVRRDAETALDLGTGCGLQALLAAKHCRRVVATDVNERALAFAAFNAALNGVENIELRQGDALAPVEGERFELIVSNPPYVISPDTAYAYRDSELPGDELCRRIVEAVPAHLAEGGFAHVLVSWAHDPAGDWDAPLRAWVAGSGCDAWLLHYRTSDPLAHAAGWLRPLGEDDPAAFEAAVDRWLPYLRERGIEAI
ncbi:MAG TPA: class I SAM-dependent methyltransferase, partial [Gaiellaceae bacterium]|nr:class I SAM-dependent methyltransferase [Gaiellaceae bacterium]